MEEGFGSEVGTMLPLLTIVLIVGIGISLTTAIWPMRVWRIFEGWRYKPGSQPTAAELARRRFSAIASLIGLIVMAGFLVKLSS